MSVSSIGGTYGLSGSGLDIDSIVTKLMTAEQTKTDALVQKRTVLEWKKTAYNTVYDSLSSFRNTVFNYKLQATLSPNKVSSSNTSVVTATANAAAADVNHSLVVAQLASGVKLTSTAKITTGTDKSTLSSQMGLENSFSMTISNGTATTSITVNPTDSIYDVVNSINNAGINVQANYDSTLDRFFLVTTNLGSSAGINISTSSTNTEGSDDGGDFIKGLHLFSGNPTTSTTSDGTNTTTMTTFSGSTGKDAVFQLDGVSLTQESNSFAISGVTYNLTGISTGTLPTDVSNGVFSGQEANVSVTSDMDTAVTNLQALVDAYNKVLADINSLINETRYTDFAPLTDAQKAEMKESEITLWNAKAQSGMLRSDSALTSLVSALRTSFSSQISGITGTYSSASSIGIKTGDYTEGGKLYLDTDKLKAALTANPNVLDQLFAATGSTTTNGVTTTDPKKQGIAGRLYDSLKTTMDQLKTIAGTKDNAQYDVSSNLAKGIKAVKTQITSAGRTFAARQALYYKQYNALESAILQISSQSTWLASYFSSSS